MFFSAAGSFGRGSRRLSQETAEKLRKLQKIASEPSENGRLAFDPLDVSPYQRIPKGPDLKTDNSHETTQNLMLLVGGWPGSLTCHLHGCWHRTCCSLAAVVSATVRASIHGPVEKWSSSRLLAALGPQEVELEHPKVVISWLL